MPRAEVPVSGPTSILGAYLIIHLDIDTIRALFVEYDHIAQLNRFDAIWKAVSCWLLLSVLLPDHATFTAFGHQFCSRRTV